jgi:hypothetical protein
MEITEIENENNQNNGKENQEFEKENWKKLIKKKKELQKDIKIDLGKYTIDFITNILTKGYFSKVKLIGLIVKEVLQYSSNSTEISFFDETGNENN